MVIQWKKLTFISALILSLSSMSAFAQNVQPQPMPPKSDMMKQHYQNVVKELGLTADQKQKLDVIMQETRTQADPISRSIMEKRRALNQYIFSPQATKEQALTQARDISNLRYQLEETKINAMFKAKCVLTPAQQQKFAELHQRKMMELQRRNPGMGPMMPGPSGPPAPGTPAPAPVQ